MSEMPIGEAELLIFVMDGSGSMKTTDTFDQRRRADHLYDLVKATMERLAKSTRKPIYRISLIYFDHQVYPVEKEGRKYFTLDEALEYIKNPVEVTKMGSTNIAGALRKAMEIMNDFYKDETLPQNKRITVFLFTDGVENVENDNAVKEVANQIKAHPSSPILATVSFGTSGEMNKGLLVQIASESSERQKRHLKLAKVANQLEDINKLFIDGNVGGEITKQKAEALRNFVYVLSVTKEA
jgi:Mg-chelatase subunit ChlD